MNTDIKDPPKKRNRTYTPEQREKMIANLKLAREKKAAKKVKPVITENAITQSPEVKVVEKIIEPELVVEIIPKIDKPSDKPPDKPSDKSISAPINTQPVKPVKPQSAKEFSKKLKSLGFI